MSRPITPRLPRIDLSTVPRHWLRGHAAATGFVNAVSMLFPWGERFFVRSVHAYKGVWSRDPGTTSTCPPRSGRSWATSGLPSTC